MEPPEDAILTTRMDIFRLTNLQARPIFLKGKKVKTHKLVLLLSLLLYYINIFLMTIVIIDIITII